eukprot:5323062-Prymnesium_polylepis.1
MQPQFLGTVISGYTANPTCRRTPCAAQGQLALLHTEQPYGEAAKRLTHWIAHRSDQLGMTLGPARNGGGAGPAGEGAAPPNSFAVPETLFPHARGTSFYPQPYLAARIRKGTSGWEHAVLAIGKPY